MVREMRVLTRGGPAALPLSAEASADDVDEPLDGPEGSEVLLLLLLVLLVLLVESRE